MSAGCSACAYTRSVTSSTVEGWRGGVTGEPLNMGLRLSDVKLPHNEASGSLEIAMCPKPYADQRAADAALQNADASASGGSVGRSPRQRRRRRKQRRKEG